MRIVTENILIDQKSLAIIDFTPFWGTSDFALAIFANFVGPRQGSITPLQQFSDIRDFDHY